MWRQYPPRSPPRRIVIPAPPPKPYPAPRNQIIIHECPSPRITHSIQRLAILQMNPELYSQQYNGSLLDSAEIIQQIRSSELPIDIVSVSNIAGRKKFSFFCDALQVEQILSTISNSNTATQEHGFNGSTSNTQSSMFDHSKTVGGDVDTFDTLFMHDLPLMKPFHQ